MVCRCPRDGFVEGVIGGVESGCNLPARALHGAAGCLTMTSPMSTSERVARRRAKLRALGLRPVQLWVPDTGAPGFAEECRRQSRLIAERATEASRAEEEAWERISEEAAAE